MRAKKYQLSLSLIFGLLILTCPHSFASEAKLDFESLTFEEFQAISKSIVQVLTLMETESPLETLKNEGDFFNKENKQTSKNSLFLDLIISKAIARPGDQCFFGGWVSTKNEFNRCTLPWKLRRPIQKFGPKYAKEFYCKNNPHYSNHFRCNPIVFGPGSDNDQKGHCIPIKQVAGENSYKGITQQCYEASKKNLPKHFSNLKNKKDPKKNLAFQSIYKEVLQFCKTNNKKIKTDACKGILPYVSHYQENNCFKQEGEKTKEHNKLSKLIANIIDYEENKNKNKKKKKRKIASENDKSAAITVLDDGTASFQKIMDTINSAKESIDLETFIFSKGTSARLIAQALMRKAKQGVKVRVLLDASVMYLEMDKYYVKAFKEHGIEVRYYNKVSALRVVSSQYRNHRKHLIVDGKKVITGGRNIGDDYFNASKKLNYVDRDIYLEGNITKDIKKSFNNYWNSRLSKAPKLPRKPSYTEECSPRDCPGNRSGRSALWHYNKKMKEARSFFKTNQKDKKNAKKFREEGRRKLKNAHSGVCQNTEFISDRPGKWRKTRVLGKRLKKEFAKAKKSIEIESPYFIPGLGLSKQLKKILKKKSVKVSVLTNSLRSTDNLFIVAAFNRISKKWSKKGVKFYLYSGNELKDAGKVAKRGKENLWGLHSKTMLIDDKNFFLTSYNVDPRSHNINSESAIFCKDSPKLTTALKKSINKRKKNAVKLNKNALPEDGRKLHFGVSAKKKRLYHLIKVPSVFIKDLL